MLTSALPTDWQVETGTMADARALADSLGIPVKRSWRRRQLLDTVKAGLSSLRAADAEPAAEPAAVSAPELPAFIARIPTLATKLASHYLMADPATPTDRELQLFNDYIDAEYRTINAIVRYTAQDVELPEVIEIWRKTKVLTISIAHIEHPFLSARMNARFRAVHDWHHIRSGADSSLSGEIETYKWARMTAQREIWWLLHSEIVLQAAACIATGKFQPQKFVR